MLEFTVAALLTRLPPVWITPPTWDGNDLVGKAKMTCDVAPKSRGSFEDLYAFLKNEIETSADKVHAGPTEVTYEGKDGVGYDVTHTVTKGNQSVTVRGDLVLVRDSNSLYQSLISKSVVGTGAASNIRRLDGEIDLIRRVDDYEANITTTVRVSRPKIVPKEKFIQIVKKQVEESLIEEGMKTLQEFQNVL